jgi:hypothetical protein
LTAADLSFDQQRVTVEIMEEEHIGPRREFRHEACHPFAVVKAKVIEYDDSPDG